MPEEPARGSACRLLLRSVCLSNVFRCFSLLPTCFFCVYFLYLHYVGPLFVFFSLWFFVVAAVLHGKLRSCLVASHLLLFLRVLTTRWIFGVSANRSRSGMCGSRRGSSRVQFGYADGSTGNKKNQHHPRCIRQPARGSASCPQISFAHHQSHAPSRSPYDTAPCQGNAPEPKRTRVARCALRSTHPTGATGELVCHHRARL